MLSDNTGVPKAVGVNKQLAEWLTVPEPLTIAQFSAEVIDIFHVGLRELAIK